MPSGSDGFLVLTPLSCLQTSFSENNTLSRLETINLGRGRLPAGFLHLHFSAGDLSQEISLFLTSPSLGSSRLPLIGIILVVRKPSCFFMPHCFGSFYCSLHCFAHFSGQGLYVFMLNCTLFSCNTASVTIPESVLRVGFVSTSAMRDVLLLYSVKIFSKGGDVMSSCTASQSACSHSQMIHWCSSSRAGVWLMVMSRA